MKDTNVVQRLMAFLMSIVAMISSVFDGNLKGGIRMNTQATRKMRSLTALVIATFMVFTLFGGISLRPMTAYANTAEELLTTITAVGASNVNPATSANIGYSEDNVVIVSFRTSSYGQISYSTSWGWWGYGWTATVTPADGYTITKCVFYDDANRPATDSEAPFVVETTEEDKTPKVNDTPILANTSKGIKKIDVYGYATYTITKSSMTNGSVTVKVGDDDATSAAEGATVILTVAPETGYELDTLTVTDADSNSVSVENNQFTMPAKNVTVNATFKLSTTTNTPTYTVTIPATLEVANKGWNELTGGITAKGSDFADNQKLSITASSTNSWALKKDETNKVGYNLVASGNSESTYSSTAEPASWEFSKTELTANGGDGTTKTAGIVVEDYSSKPAGSYEDTVTFTASVETESVQNITFTVKRVSSSGGEYTDGTYTVESGTTWQQFINSGNAPACLSIGTSGTYSGKVCHDMDYGLFECGGTLIANVADKKRAKSSDVIIDGATYGCSDYLGYKDHD